MEDVKLCYPTKELIEEYFGDDFTEALGKFGKKAFCRSKKDGLYFEQKPDASKWKNGVYKKIKEQNSDLMGIDFPVLIEQDKNKKTIMLVGGDPNRTCKYTDGKTSKNSIFVGTPFAVDVEDFRYKKFFERILKPGYNIYVTDVFKFYAQSGKEVCFKKFAKMQKHGELADFCPIELLKKEIKIVKPNAIIALGNNAFDVLNGVMEGVQKCPHPSHISIAKTEEIASRF